MKIISGRNIKKVTEEFENWIKGEETSINLLSENSLLHLNKEKVNDEIIMISGFTKSWLKKNKAKNLLEGFLEKNRWENFGYYLPQKEIFLEFSCFIGAQKIDVSSIKSDEVKEEILGAINEKLFKMISEEFPTWEAFNSIPNVKKEIIRTINEEKESIWLKGYKQPSVEKMKWVTNAHYDFSMLDVVSYFHNPNGFIDEMFTIFKKSETIRERVLYFLGYSYYAKEIETKMPEEYQIKKEFLTLAKENPNIKTVKVKMMGNKSSLLPPNQNYEEEFVGKEVTISIPLKDLGTLHNSAYNARFEDYRLRHLIGKSLAYVFAEDILEISYRGKVIWKK